MNIVTITQKIHEIDDDEVFFLSQDLQAICGILFALSDSAEQGNIIDYESLAHLGKFAAECRDKFKGLFPADITSYH